MFPITLGHVCKVKCCMLSSLSISTFECDEFFIHIFTNYFSMLMKIELGYSLRNLTNRQRFSISAKYVPEKKKKFKIGAFKGIKSKDYKCIYKIIYFFIKNVNVQK